MTTSNGTVADPDAQWPAMVALLARVRTTLGTTGVAVMLLLIAYLAGRRGGTKAPVSPVAQQVTPSSFALVQELNAHADRLATLLTVVVVVTSFSLVNGPIHDALVSFDPSAHGFLYGALFLLGWCLFGGIVAVLGAMNPALPLSTDDEQQWRDLIARKRSENTETAINISGSLLSLLGAWIVVYVQIGWPGDSTKTSRRWSTSGAFHSRHRSVVPLAQ